MAVTKEAIAIVLDVGHSMLQHDKEKQTILQSAKNCINMILQRKIFSESKDEIALILFGTSETVNNLALPNSSEYNHIKVAQDLKPANWELLEFVNNIEGTDISADFIKGSALLVAMDLLQNTLNGKKFFTRRILFLSHFDDSFCGDKASQICEGLKTYKIDLNIIGPISFNDIDNGTCLPNFQSRTSEPMKSENVIRSILKEVNGESYSFSEALPALIYYQKKKIQPLPWNANLDIGKNLTIPISAYVKVTESKPKPWKNAYAHKLNAKIEKETSYHMNDEAQTEVGQDNIIPAYRFGTTLVPFSEEDKINMEYQSGEKGMKVLGFTKEENVHRYHYIGDKSMYIFGQKNREVSLFGQKKCELAGVILAPFIQALHETKMVAIVRYVYSARSAPKIGFLSPRIKPNYECLVFVALPFMEDLRHFMFAPLDADPNNLPTDDQLTAIDNLITSMDLTSALIDEEGNNAEVLKPKNTVNPFLQRLYQCLQHRAFYSEKPLPEIATHIKAIVNPIPEVINRAEPHMNQIRSLFPLKELIQPKTQEIGANLFSNGKSENVRKKRKSNDDSGIDSIESMVGVTTDKITKVGTIQPVKDFLYLMNQTEIHFREIFRQMEDVIYSFINDAMAKLHYAKIFACIEEYRNSSLKRGDPVMFNIFIQDLKENLITKHSIMWMKIENEKMGLISNDECESSTVTSSDASQFYHTELLGDEKDTKVEDMDDDDDDDDEDLLDQM